MFRIAALNIVLAFALVSSTSFANEAHQFRFSLLGGHVGLLGDPGSAGQNALGVGAGGGYQIDEHLFLGVDYVQSSQPNVDHHDIAVGVEWSFPEFEDIGVHASGGMSFLSNSFKSVNWSANAVGVYAGGGASFEISKGFEFGPELRYQKAFPAKSTLSKREVTTVDDSYEVLIRLSWWPEGD